MVYVVVNKQCLWCFRHQMALSSGVNASYIIHEDKKEQLCHRICPLLNWNSIGFHILKVVQLQWKSGYSLDPSGGSYMPEVEFEFIAWVSLETTTDSIPAVANPVFHCLLVYVNEHLFVCLYICKWAVGKKATADCHLGSGPELKLRWWTQTLPQLFQKHFFS